MSTKYGSTVRREGEKMIVATGEMRAVYPAGDDDAAAGQIALLQQALLEATASNRTGDAGCTYEEKPPNLEND